MSFSCGREVKVHLLAMVGEAEHTGKPLQSEEKGQCINGSVPEEECIRILERKTKEKQETLKLAKSQSEREAAIMLFGYIKQDRLGL